jgi:hypothetical protein
MSLAKLSREIFSWNFLRGALLVCKLSVFRSGIPGLDSLNSQVCAVVTAF